MLKHEVSPMFRRERRRVIQYSMIPKIGNCAEVSLIINALNEQHMLFKRYLNRGRYEVINIEGDLKLFVFTAIPRVNGQVFASLCNVLLTAASLLFKLLLTTSFYWLLIFLFSAAESVLTKDRPVLNFAFAVMQI